MSSSVRFQILLPLLAFSIGCGPVPGGALPGNLQPAPSSWSEHLGDGRAFCEIESRSEHPHSIQLDCFEHAGDLFVQSHRWALAPWWPVESWAAIWIEQPEVRVRIGDSLFELRAERIVDADLRETLLRLRGYDPVPAGIVLFRFAARS